METIFSLNTLWWVMILVYVPACLGLILIVLLQKGKGVGFGGAFGMGGGNEAIFGPRSSRSLPQQITYTMAGIFMILAVLMSIISGKVNRGAAPIIDVDPSLTAAPSDSEYDTLLDPTAPVVADELTPGQEGAPVVFNLDPNATATPADATPDSPPISVDAAAEEAPAAEEEISIEIPAESATEEISIEIPAENAAEEISIEIPAESATEEMPVEEAPVPEAPAEADPAGDAPIEEVAPSEEAPAETVQ